MESAWCVIWSGKAVAIQATWAHRANLLLFLVLPHHQQWPFIHVISSHRPRHRHCESSLLTHVILCKIWVRPRYFIKWVRPGKIWPGWPAWSGWPNPVATLLGVHPSSRSWGGHEAQGHPTGCQRGYLCERRKEWQGASHLWLYLHADTIWEVVGPRSCPQAWRSC